MNDSPTIDRVFVTGATGFVGRYIVRRLLAEGITPVCLVRSTERLRRQHRNVSPDRIVSVVGDVCDRDALSSAMDGCDAVIHLVGIILQRRLRRATFHKIHVVGTHNVVDAAQGAGVSRFLHISALGTRENAVAPYHRTKWEGELCVRASGLDWTVFQPSLIHGPDGEFMQLMRRFVCGWLPPIIPYFGDGRAKLQPISVLDVADCFVSALSRDETIGKAYPLGGPKEYSWIGFYNACRALMPQAKSWKPMVSQPVPLAKALAKIVAAPMAMAELIAPTLGMFRFDGGQVTMSQEDNVCDHTIAEQAFGVRVRPFEDELSVYAERIP